MIELLVRYSGSRPPRALRSAAIVMALFVAAAMVRPAEFVPEAIPSFDGHALASLDMASTRAWCGAPSAFSNQFRAPFFVRDNPGNQHKSMRQLMITQAGGFETFCLAIDQQFVNNENSLMVLEWWLLKWWPEMSFVDMARALRWMQLAGLWFVCFAILELGGTVWLAGGALFCGLNLLTMMHDHITSVYPWLFVLVSVACAAYALCLQRKWTRRLAGVILAGVIAGVYSSFGVNMRTSYLPIYVALFVLFAIASERHAVDAARPRAAIAGRAGLMAVAFAAGFWSFQYFTITRYIPDGLVYNSSQHSISHPLVLALAIPENDFSRSQGIRWMDSVGGQLALRADPKAVYLGPGYDAALFKLYRQLWRDHTREMAGVYWMKAQVAGKHMLTILRGGPGTSGLLRRRLLTPLDVLPDGRWMLLAYLAVAGAAFARYWTAATPAMFFAGLLTVAAILLYLESAVIMSLYVPNYHNYLAFFAMLLCLAIAQAGVNVAWRVVLPRIPWRR